MIPPYGQFCFIKFLPWLLHPPCVQLRLILFYLNYSLQMCNFAYCLPTLMNPHSCPALFTTFPPWLLNSRVQLRFISTFLPWFFSHTWSFTCSPTLINPSSWAALLTNKLSYTYYSSSCETSHTNYIDFFFHVYRGTYCFAYPWRNGQARYIPPWLATSLPYTPPSCANLLIAFLLQLLLPHVVQLCLLLFYSDKAFVLCDVPYNIILPRVLLCLQFSYPDCSSLVCAQLRLLLSYLDYSQHIGSLPNCFPTLLNPHSCSLLSNFLPLLHHPR